MAMIVKVILLGLFFKLLKMRLQLYKPIATRLQTKMTFTRKALLMKLTTDNMFFANPLSGTEQSMYLEESVHRCSKAGSYNGMYGTQVM